MLYIWACSGLNDIAPRSDTIAAMHYDDVTSLPFSEQQINDRLALHLDIDADAVAAHAKEGKGWAELSSGPPSPPESGSTTPRLSIAPCPPRLHPLIPPPNYGTVDIHAIYRSSFPQERNMDFIRALKLKSVLTLVETEPSPEFESWMCETNIKQLKINLATNKEGQVNTSLDSLYQALLFILDTSNHPLYIHCNQGKHRTGCVVACLRKIQKLPMEEIIKEYYAYAWPKVREGDIELIKSFDSDAFLEYAKPVVDVKESEALPKRIDSGLEDIDRIIAASMEWDEVL